MTKEILLKIIEHVGSFWYVIDSYCPGRHCLTLLKFKEADASDVDRFDNLINNCFIHADCESGKLVLVAQEYIGSRDCHISQLYPTPTKGICLNYSPAEAQMIIETQ